MYFLESAAYVNLPIVIFSTFNLLFLVTVFSCIERSLVPYAMLYSDASPTVLFKKMACVEPNCISLKF